MCEDLQTETFSLLLTGNPGLSDWPNEPGKYFCGPEEHFKWILVSVVCSIMKLFKFTFNKNLKFAPQGT
jgi:hypothetical protein